jgi:hypothetical protein
MAEITPYCVIENSYERETKMNINSTAFARALRQKYGTPQMVLRRLALDEFEVGGTEEKAETLAVFLRRAGLSEADIAEFRRRCDEHAEDDGNGPLGEAVSALQQFIIDKLQPEDAQIGHDLIGSLLREAGAAGEATDDLPTAVANGSRFPKNRMELERRQAQDADITIGRGSAGDSFGHADARRVRFPSQRSGASAAAVRHAPGIDRITIGV